MIATVIYDDGVVRVTPTLVRVGGTSYSVNNLVSVSVTPVERNFAGPWFFGFFLFFLWWMVMDESPRLAWSSLTVAILLFYYPFHGGRQHELVLRMPGAGMLTHEYERVLKLSDKAYLETLREAIEQAIESRR